MVAHYSRAQAASSAREVGLRHDVAGNGIAMSQIENQINSTAMDRAKSARPPAGPAAHTHYAAWAERAGNVLNSARARFFYSDGRERGGVGGGRRRER